jgi:branched-chain amino acid aminotransferase
MSDLAYFNGDYLPVDQIPLSVTDWGFVQGVTLAEQLRTFSGHAFRVQHHLERLLRGLEMVGWEQTATSVDLPAIIQQVVHHNYAQIDPLDDLGVCVFVTPGAYPGYSTHDPDHTTVCIHTYRLPFHRWHQKYREGVTLATVSTRQVPTDCWPAALKCRSRMHYYLAAKEAQQRLPGATAMLLDHQGFAAETPTANVIAYFAESGLASPPHDKILPGISLNYVVELARQLAVPFEFRDLTPAELATADEIMLTSTPFCLLPVTRFDERRFNGPGPLARQLLQAWAQDVGVDIAAQAERFAERH